MTDAEKIKAFQEEVCAELGIKLDDNHDDRPISLAESVQYRAELELKRKKYKNSLEAFRDEVCTELGISPMVMIEDNKSIIAEERKQDLIDFEKIIRNLKSDRNANENVDHKINQSQDNMSKISEAVSELEMASISAKVAGKLGLNDKTKLTNLMVQQFAREVQNELKLRGSRTNADEFNRYKLDPTMIRP